MCEMIIFTEKGSISPTSHTYCTFVHHKVRVSRLEDCCKASVFRRHVGRNAHFSFHLVKGLRHDAAGVVFTVPYVERVHRSS
jgi:hypothetical protein